MCNCTTYGENLYNRVKSLADTGYSSVQLGYHISAGIRIGLIATKGSLSYKQRCGRKTIDSLHLI